MRRRAYLTTTAAVLATPLLAGCSRDDGGDGSDGGDGGGGGGGAYGMVAADETKLGAGTADGPGVRSASRRSGGPAPGAEPGVDVDGVKEADGGSEPEGEREADDEQADHRG